VRCCAAHVLGPATSRAFPGEGYPGWGSGRHFTPVARESLRSITDGHVGVPKNHERRDVDLAADVVELLGAWWGECGKPDDGKLVFPGEGKSGYLTPSTILKRELCPAMKAAEEPIPRIGPTGEKRTSTRSDTRMRSERRTVLRSPGSHGTSAARRSR
jgi:hypothetical protein